MISVSLRHILFILLKRGRKSCQGSDGYWPSCHHGGCLLIPGQITWNMWRKSGTENFLSVRLVKQNHSWIVYTYVRNLVWTFECHWRFLFCCGWMKLCPCGTEAFKGLIVYPLDDRWMHTEHCRNIHLTCGNLCQCHVVDHKYKRTVPGLIRAHAVRNLRIITLARKEIRSFFRSSGTNLKIYAHDWKCVVRLVEHTNNAL
jgi:hypothetical protein